MISPFPPIIFPMAAYIVHFIYFTIPSVPRWKAFCFCERLKPLKFVCFQLGPFNMCSLSGRCRNNEQITCFPHLGGIRETFPVSTLLFQWETVFCLKYSCLKETILLYLLSRFL